LHLGKKAYLVFGSGTDPHTLDVFFTFSHN
jgi:hypothetical protein